MARNREPVVVGLILLGLLTVFFWPALAPGGILAPAEMALESELFSPLAPPDFAGAHNYALFDVAYQMLPWRWFVWNSLRSGEFPLWNPDIYCGAPMAGSMQAAVFYSVTWLTALMPFAAGFVFAAMLRLWIAAFGMYWLAREYKLSRHGSLVGATSYMLCAYHIVWLNYPIGNAAAWLPWIALMCERAMSAGGLFEARRAIGGLALATAMAWTGGHAEAPVDVLLAAGLYCLLRCWLERGSSKRHWFLRAVAAPGAGVALGTLLAAPAILFFLEWLPLSHEFKSRSDFHFVWFKQEIWGNLRALVNAIAPNFWGNPSWPYAWRSAWGPTYFHEAVLYIGAAPLVLATGLTVTTLRDWKCSPAWTKAWLVVGAFFLGRALQLPPFDWLSQAPVLRLALPARLRIIAMFAACLFAAGGTDLLLRQLRDGKQAALMFRTGALAGGLSAALACLNKIADWREVYPAMAFAGFAGVLRLAARRQFGSERRIAIAVLVIAAADLILFGRDFNGVSKTADLSLSNVPAVNEIRADRGEFRTTALAHASIPDHPLLAGLQEIRGMDFQLENYDRYIRASGAYVDWIGHGLILDSAQSPLLRALNLKYVMSAGDDPPPGHSAYQWNRAENIWLGAAIDPQPRGFMVFQAVAAANNDEAADLLASDPDAIFNRVVLSDAADLSVPVHPAGSATATLAGQAAKQMEWRVAADQAGWFVTSDAYYPGWEATLDGAPVPVYRANLAFRAVRVPAGEHTIVYRYRPRPLRHGIACSALAMLMLMLLQLIPLMKPAGDAKPAAGA